MIDKTWFKSLTGALTYLGVILAGLYWFLEATADSVILQSHALTDDVSSPAFHTIYMRLMVMGLLVLFGAYGQFLLNGRRRTEKELMEHRVQLEDMVKSRTEALLASNEQLLKEIEDRRRAEGAILQAKDDWERTFDSVPDLIAILDLNFRIVKMNRAMAERVGGAAVHDVLGMACYHCVHDTDSPIAACPFQKLQMDGREHCAEIYEEHLNGYFLVTVTPLCGPDGKLTGAVHIARDITARKLMEDELRDAHGELEKRVEERTAELATINARLKQEVEERRKAEDALRHSEGFLKSSIDALAAHVAIIDENGVILSVNKAWKRFGESNGFTGAASGVGMNYLGVCDVAPGEFCQEAQAVAKGIRRVIAREKDEFHQEYFCPGPEGARWFVVRATRFEGSGPVRAVIAHEDITERKRIEEQLIHDAFHDSLTGLPNRALFLDRLDHVARQAKRHGDALFGVLFLDLDHFKLINDSLGHLAGDRLLIAIAKRLEGAVRISDSVARLGGDEFAVLLDELKDASEAVLLSERIQNELSLPFNLDRQEIFTSASIGIALSDAEYKRPEDLLRDADTAVYRAKTGGRSRHEMFDRDMHVQAVSRLQLETEIRKAVEREEFVAYYQPVVSLVTGEIAGFEALIRWNSPERGLVMPGQFIPLAEETGLIVPIGRWILRESCLQMREWLEKFPGFCSGTMSVNVSARQIRHNDLEEEVKQVLIWTGLDPSALKLEITESAIMENAEAGIATLSALKNLGVQFSIDDFGTGYSSLSQLHRFPIDFLKIDRSFVSRMNDDEDNYEVVRTIVALAHNLGLAVIAEGPETAEQVEELRKLGCEYGQGYFFSRPVDEENAEALLARSRNTDWVCGV